MKLPPIQLIALDLDGTTLQSNHEISQRTLEAVQHLRARAVHISICTGRPVRNAGNFARALGLTERAMLYNGAVIYNYDEERTLHYDTLEPTLASKVIAHMQDNYPQVSGSLERIDGWFWDEKRWQQQKPVNQPTGIGNIADFVSDGIIKLLFKDFTGKYDLSTLAQSLQDLSVDVTWSSASLLEVMPQGINKRYALERWAQELGIPQSQTMAFGDQDNDKEMLQWAGVGVAMGNAPAAIQAVADYVSSSNDEEGVAVVLEQLIAQHYA